MTKTKQRVIFSLFILSICYGKSTNKFIPSLSSSFTVGTTMADDSPCGDWEQYKDEKCIKVFDILETEENAEKTCNQEGNGTLITIGSNDEQNFLSKLLFETHKVVDTIWVGAKKSSNKFKWADDSDMIFSYWLGGYPNTKEDNICVEMMPEFLSMGKWINEPCNKRNLVVCQKMQVYPCNVLQKKLLDTRKLLNYITLFSDKMSHFKIFFDHNNRHQILIFPTQQDAHNREEAIGLCKQFSASLVEIESSEKQLIVLSFLSQIPTSQASYLWLGGYKDSDGKLKWMSNGKEISYNNWANKQLGSDTYVLIYNAGPRGQWLMGTNGSYGVMCETSSSF
jgi:hypothetical protein